MKIRLLSTLILLFVGLSVADNTISISIAPTWPSKNIFIKNSSRKAMWDTEVAWGISFDDRITVGAQGNFMWHIEKFKETDTTANPTEPTKIQSKTKNFSLPVSAFITLSPIPQYKLHPVARVSVGYNSVIVKHENYDPKFEAAVDKFDGYYNGLIARFGLDAVYDLGEKSSVFTGFHYQVSKVTKDDRELNMNAPVLKFGISVFY